ncbi:hypothetical protein [Paraburkholderia panacisoli]|nr:hypothetical protein [Paraburkholderia panacisoli]
MKLRTIANGAIQGINRNQQITWVQNSGYTTAADGTRTPNQASTPVWANVQALSGTDLRHMDGLNIQGVMRSVYLYGDVEGIVRANGQGGDILQFPMSPGGTMHDWLVTQVMETWSEWCRVIVTLQNP